MLSFMFQRVLYTLPIMFGVALVCFALVHLAPGDPLVSIMPPDASQELQQQLMEIYGFNKSYPEQFFMGVLVNNNISYEHNKPVGKYFIEGNVITNNSI